MNIAASDVFRVRTEYQTNNTNNNNNSNNIIILTRHERDLGRIGTFSGMCAIVGYGIERFRVRLDEPGDIKNSHLTNVLPY